MSYGRAIIIVNDDMKEGEENAPSKMIFKSYEVAGIVFQNVGYCCLWQWYEKAKWPIEQETRITNKKITKVLRLK